MKFTRDREENRQKENELEELKQTINLEKGDTTAIIIAALTTIFPFALLIFSLIMFIVWILFT